MCLASYFTVNSPLNKLFVSLIADIFLYLSIFNTPVTSEDAVMKHRLSYRLIAQGGLNAWYNLDPRITNDFPR
ncbi:hypothetical protein TUM17576_22460 [Enterobacter hormaechei]|nr:hypothetical protein TUM17576_22460 [Enterobacter hormaechei]